MIELSDYSLEEVWKGSEFDMYRGRLAGSPPILVVAAANAARLEHEYLLADELDPAWAARPLALTRHEGREMLILDDPGGHPLESVLGRPLELASFLPLAIALAAALRQVHARGLIHKDIRPANVLVDSQGKVRLTGFGIASRLPRERQPAAALEIIAGTLAYMAPEQTGRMNRSIDARSDLYSLGVTLYEIATGTLPFVASDALELIHCHIARQPMAPRERARALPAVVESIVLKLLEKDAEDRYQTAAGLEGDLRRCLAAWAIHGRIEPFTLGQDDVPDRLLIPEKLYGREAEIGLLRDAFARVVTRGNAELVLVSGYPGIGKSSIVNELHKVLLPPRGLFAAGKSDQFQRNTPFATLAQAFQSLVLQLLNKDEAELSGWRESLRAALGPNGQLMVNLIPELALVMGEQPPVPAVEPQDSHARFHQVFRQLLSVFATPQHPLALFLDDLQWLDTATLELLESLVGDPETRCLMIIGAYRDNEVGAAHPLTQTLEAIRSAGGAVLRIRPGPLNVGSVAQLLADALHTDVDQVCALAGLVREKTGGNPFFTIQFITALAEQALLVFDAQRSAWTWDMDRIRAKGITDNVADLMAAKLGRLSPGTRASLGQFACLGNSAEASTLSTLRDGSEQELHAALREAVDAGLILRCGDSYEFLHDRVREASYALIPPADRASAHLRTGRALLSQTPPQRLEECIFEIVNQLDRGAAEVRDRQECELIAGLNLMAGKRARTSSAFASAQGYFIAGCELLGEDRWQHHPRLTFDLELLRAECEFVNGELASAEQRLVHLAARASALPDRAAVVCLAVLLYFTTGRSDRAVDIGLEFLRHVGIDWSAHPTEEDVGREYRRMRERLAQLSTKNLSHLPQMTDPACVASMDVLGGIFPAAHYVDRYLLELVLLRMTNLSLEHGNADGTSVAYAALNMVLGPRFGDYQTAYELGQIACELVDRRVMDRFKARVYSCFASFTLPWAHHLPASQPLLRLSVEVGSAIGDLGFAAYTFRHLITNLLVSGVPLGELQEQAAQVRDFARHAGLGVSPEHFVGQMALIRALRGVEPDARGDAHGDDAAWPPAQLEEQPHLAMMACFHWVFRLQERFFAQDYAAGIEAATQAGGILWSARSCFEEAEYHYYAALTRAAACDHLPADQRARHREALSAHHRQIAAWAEYCPANFANRAALVGAEIARLEGRELDAERLYETAIRSAREYGFIQNEGLGNELAARFHSARGFESIAANYLRIARSCYLRWGATAKVRQLEQEHPHLGEQARQPALTAILGVPVGHLDFGTMFKASQALSSEIVLAKLIEALMRIAVEHAGAQRGVLVLLRHGEARIAAEAVTLRGKVAVVHDEKPASSSELPESALNYVIRARRSLILDDAAASDAYADDEYIRRRRPKSVLCIPIIKQAALIGALYLENRLTACAFSPERITVLEFLASQAAISLENALLFADLKLSEGFLAETQRMSSTGSWRWSVSTGTVAWSREHYRILGRDPGHDPVPTFELFMTLVHPEDRACLAEQLAGVLRDRARLEASYRIVLSDGTIKHLYSVGRPIIAESGEVRDYVGSTMDVSERRRSEDALREAEAKLAQASRLTTLGELAASIAHEVNQPLAAIVSNAQSGLLWLDRPQPDVDKVRQIIERIARDGLHAGEVIRSLRSLIRKSAPEIASFDFNAIVREVLEMMRVKLRRGDVTLELSLSESLTSVAGDRVQLQQVMVNLVANGIDAMKPVTDRPRILRVSSGFDDAANVAISVEDSGVGIADGLQERIFDPLFTTKREGMGMGLAICRSIIVAHRGRLWAEPRMPHGSVFRFTLPAQAPGLWSIRAAGHSI